MKRFALLLVIASGSLGVALWLAVGSAPADNLDPTEPPNQDVFVVRAFFQDRQMVADLASWIEPWEVDYNKGVLVVDVTTAEFERLRAAGFRLEVDNDLTAEIRTPRFMLPGQLSGIPGFPCYRTVEETYTAAAALAAAYPQLASWTDIGDSWEKTTPGGQPGYDIMLLRLTNDAIPGPKPKIFIMAAIHAREYTTAELVTRFAEELVQNYSLDPDTTWLLDHHEFHLLLQANPDGRKRAENGQLWRKNTNNNYCSNTNSRGADLNRNFQFLWGCCGGSSDNVCSEIYRGPSQASEPETQAVQNYIFAQFPDQRDPDIAAAAPITATGVFIDLHSYSELMLWPWGFTAQPTGNGLALQTLGRKLSFFNGYYPEQSIGLYPTDGTTGDFAYGELGLAAFTYELGTAFFEGCAAFENNILPVNLPSLLYASKVARTPYLTPAGPDILSVAFSENIVEAGTPITLSATANDTRFNNENGPEPVQSIAAAEYYIDIPHWITSTTPTPIPMAPGDGAFNSPLESVEAPVDTSALPAGRHILFVRGRDAAGNWGAYSAAFLYIIDPVAAPTIQGRVIAADNGQPLTATVSASGIFHAETDPSTGFYQMRVISETYNLTAQPFSPNYAAVTRTGVVAQDFQTIEMDFVLYPYCAAFEDDVEAGNVGWTAQAPWTITSEASHSPAFSWTDSPGGNYNNNLSVSLTSPVFDLSDYQGVMLEFWQICDTESGYDFCRVELSVNGGATWEEVVRYDGPSSAWEKRSITLPQLNNESNARIRFRLTSDATLTDDGWHLDDVRLIGTGPVCTPEVFPTAAFISSSPDPLGHPTTFTNTSSGSSLSFEWDLGDGIAVVTSTHPTYVYPGVGSYTVTLTATNNLGSDVKTGRVDILIPAQATFTTSSPDPLGVATVFTNTSTGTDLSFLWNFGDGETSDLANPSHAYTATGTFTVILTAANLVGSDLATSTVEIIEPRAPATLYLPLIIKPLPPSSHLPRDEHQSTSLIIFAFN